MKHILITAALALTVVTTAAHAAQWIVVERNDARITSFDRASIGHYDNNDPGYYFPKGEAIRGVVTRFRFLKWTPNRSEPDVDTRDQLNLFNCSEGTTVPVWIETSYRGVPVGRRTYAPPQQLRSGFEPVVNQWNPKGSAADKIYRAVCNANIAGRADILVQ